MKFKISRHPKGLYLHGKADTISPLGFDTNRKRFINRKDVINIVLAGHDVEIIDKPTKSDITNRVLLETLANMGLGIPYPNIVSLLRRVA